MTPGGWARPGQHRGRHIGYSEARKNEDNRPLAGIEPREVYEAAVTVLMRVVFLLYAEERRLLPLDDPVYNANYAILPVRERLEERSRLSEESLAYAHGSAFT